MFQTTNQITNHHLSSSRSFLGHYIIRQGTSVREALQVGPPPTPKGKNIGLMSWINGSTKTGK